MSEKELTAATAAIVVTIKSVVDPFWIEFCTKDVDVFLRDHCGYWAHGVGQDDERGWLLYEHGGERRPPSKPADILKRWREGLPIAPPYYRLDVEAAKLAWAFGVRRSGEKWFENGDANDYDIAIQQALLGEIRYG